MTPELAEDLIPLAAQLVGTVRDYGPEDVARVLARVPQGRHDALAVVLAAMVDPDARASELLAWLDGGLEYQRLVAAGVNRATAGLLAAERVAEPRRRRVS